MEEQAAAVQLPKYRCHKEVWAAKIVGIERGPAQWRLNLDVRGKGETDANEIVGMAWYDKHQPEVGGYFVQYVDGYKSYSPAKALEDGYTRIDETGRRLVAGDIGFAGDALEYAWGVIANAFGGNWTKATEEWQTAAARFRDESWHPWLDTHGYTIHAHSAERGTKRDLLERPDSCLGRSRPDEFVFLLCARDSNAPAAVRSWAMAYFNAGGKRSKFDDALQCASNMEGWRKENVDKPQDAKREAQSHRLSETNRCLRILLDAGITDDALLDRIRSGEEA